MNIFALIKALYVEAPVADEMVWHKCKTPVYPVDLVTGGSSSHGQMWRRKVDGKWQYQQDPETLDEIERRIW